jgi:hypothetical protein
VLTTQTSALALNLLENGIGLMELSGWRRCPLVAKVS